MKNTPTIILTSGVASKTFIGSVWKNQVKLDTAASQIVFGVDRLKRPKISPNQYYQISSKQPMVYTPNKEISVPTESFLKQKHPKSHNHYRFQDFFAFDRVGGTINDWNESRNIFTSEDFIIGLVEGLEEEVGPASSVIMYTIGCQWGLQDSEFFQKWFSAEFSQNIRQSNLMFLLETWWWPFTAQGWGRWEVDMSDRKHGCIFINLFDSAVARTLGDVGKPVCHLYAGLFAGFFGALVKKPLSCIELQCYSMGETYCKFLLGNPDKIDAAAFWLNEGANARDIQNRIQNGERLR